MGFERFIDQQWGWEEIDQSMSDLAIVIANPNMNDCPIIFCYDKFLDHCGYTLREVVGRNCRFMQGPQTEPDAVAELRRSIQDNVPVNVVITNYRKDGSIFKNNVLMKPLTGDKPLIVAVQRRIG